MLRSAVMKNNKNLKVCDHGKMPKTRRSQKMPKMFMSAAMKNTKNLQVCGEKMPKTHRSKVTEKFPKCLGQQL